MGAQGLPAKGCWGVGVRAAGQAGAGRGRQGCVCPCRYRRRKQSCPSCHHSWCEDLRDEEMALRKVGAGASKVCPGDRGRRVAGSRGRRAHEHRCPVWEVWGSGWLGLAPVLPASSVSSQVDFIWINRDQKHFEWFVSLLTKLEMEQAEQEPGGEREEGAVRCSPPSRGAQPRAWHHPRESPARPEGPRCGAGPPPVHSRAPLGHPGRFLEMHMYMTSALGKNDVKAVGLQMALDLLAAKEQRDSITGLRTRTQPGRPDWSKVRAGPALPRCQNHADGQGAVSPGPARCGGHHGRVPFRSGRMHWDIWGRSKPCLLLLSSFRCALGVREGGGGEERESPGLLLRLAGACQSHQGALRALRLPLLQRKLLTAGPCLAACPCQP